MPAIPTPDFDDPKEIYAFFGLAVYSANLLESSFINWTVALRLGTIEGATCQDFDYLFDYFETRTLGQLLKATHLLAAIPDGVDLVLRRALSERNRLVHHFFREHAANATHPAGRKTMLDDLISMIELFDHADALVTPVYQSLWKVLGIDESMIERELNEIIRETEVRFMGST